MISGYAFEEYSDYYIPSKLKETKCSIKKQVIVQMNFPGYIETQNTWSEMLINTNGPGNAYLEKSYNNLLQIRYVNILLDAFLNVLVVYSIQVSVGSG